MLSNCRALDLTDEKGFLCGKILADLGVDVVKVEKPGGDPGRNRGPFWHDIPEPEKSLYWFAYNSNKRGITLNIADSEGQEIFKTLAKHADFIIESYHPGYLDSVNLGYSALSEINPGIIVVSITPFGQAGPYRDYVASDMVALAMSGLQYQTGFRSLRLGMVVQNFGPRAQYDGTFTDYRTSIGTGTDPTERSFGEADQPLGFKAGVTADFATMTGYSLGSEVAGCLSAQFEHPSDHAERVNLGTEFWYRDMVALRGGYNINYDADRFTLGFGVKVPWGGNRTLFFDYAYADQGDLTDTSSLLNQPHRFGLGLEF